ncbi:MAG: DUF3467 domain-containing protein [Paludibacteraceae bacterium]|jgi:predicted transcriptional regulator|nr:DUF3467 domain-containing protein [Paludibacteraceae bacterium]MEE3483663.1 DUF3467 domain-containing protein [Bacteroidales bacterium]
MQDNENDKMPKNQINVELSEEVAEGVYSNMAIISHSSSEFVLDFLRIMPNSNKAKVKSRIILTPEHAKRLFKALEDNLQKFENQFGKVQRTESGFNPPFPINLTGSGEA